MSKNNLHPETLAVHVGWNGDPATDACAVPVYRTTAYNFKNAQDGAAAGVKVADGLKLFTQLANVDDILADLDQALAQA